MDLLSNGIPGVQCILDTMIIIEKSDKEHLQNLEKVVKRDASLRAKREKCENFKKRGVLKA